MPQEHAISETEAQLIAAKIEWSGRRIVAIIGAVGVIGAALVAGAVAYVGHRYKKLMENRNLSLREAEEERQRLDTFIGSIGLLSTKEGEEVSSTQRAAVLFVLAKTGELPFALRLLRTMWTTNKIDSSSAVWLVNAALSKAADDSKDSAKAQQLQIEAAELLHDNVDRLYLSSGSYEWPDCLDGRWEAAVPVEAREYLVLTIFKIVADRPQADWDSAQLAGALVDLYCAAKADPDPSVRVAAAKGASTVTKALLSQVENIVLPGDHDPTPLADLDRRLVGWISELETSEGEQSRPTADLEEYLDKLEAWRNVG